MMHAFYLNTSLSKKKRMYNTSLSLIAISAVIVHVLFMPAVWHACMDLAKFDAFLLCDHAGGQCQHAHGAQECGC